MTSVVELGCRLWWRRFLSRNALPWEELARFPSLPSDEQRRILAERLLSQVRYFGNREDALPEWREAARIRDPDELWQLWTSLPVVTKQMLRDRFPPAEIQARFGLDGRINSTGGSTGEPTRFFHDEAMIRAGNATAYYAQCRMGWHPGIPIVKVWGSERDIGKANTFRNSLYNRFLRVNLVDGYRLTDETVGRVLALVARHRQVAVCGFSSLLEFVARRIVERRAEPPPGKVLTAWNGGEMLFPEQVEVFRRAFGVPILNLYGGRELSVMACQFEENGTLHVLRPWLFLEVVDDDARPVSPGESGRLLFTSTVCRGTPFLRYEIGDLGCSDATTETEAGVASVRELHGRTAGLLRLPGNRTINNIFWNHLFKEYSEVRRFQVILRKDGSIKILLEGDGFPPDREAACRSILQRFLGDLPIVISWVERVSLTREGKLMQVVREQS